MPALARELVSVTLSTLWELAATFELLDPSSDLGRATLPDGCDGLLLLGGGDIDRSCYTQSDSHASGATLSIAATITVPDMQTPASYGVDLSAATSSRSP